MTNTNNIANTNNNNQPQAAKSEDVTKPQQQAVNPEVVTKPAAAPAPVVKAKKSLWKSLWHRICPTGVEAMILLIIVALVLLVLNDWYITDHLNDVIKSVNEIQAELSKPWYQFW